MGNFLATDTVEKLMKQKRLKLPKGTFVHSDQGSHYTSPTYQKLLKKYNLGQSMSRRGSSRKSIHTLLQQPQISMGT
jgi:putative transposase